MTTTREATDKWFTVYVPPTAGGTESYLRLGSPDATTEESFLATLQASYQGSVTQPAVQAAFGNTASAGMVLYTVGDAVQFINGRSDTRVLNDSYLVHVLNKETVDAGATAQNKASTTDKTYRSYFRLGKPNSVVESQLQGKPDEASLASFAKTLAPTPLSPMELGAGNTQRDLALTGDIAARRLLETQATSGDPIAIDKLDELLKSSDARADQSFTIDTVAQTAARKWARSTLSAVHAKFASQLKINAIVGDTASRTKLSTGATNGDPVARQKLVEIYEGVIPVSAAGQTFSNVPAAQQWAKTVLDTLPQLTSEMLARWSLGEGVALYSDRPITMTTPGELKVTVGADSRTVLGPSYSEVYDVSDDVLQQIRDGSITQAKQIGERSIVTASLSQRARGTGWRTTKYDSAKALSYTVTDGGSFSLSHAYSLAAGLKLSNGLSASFDASIGIAVSAPLSFKVEYGPKRMKTAWTLGETCFTDKQDLRGSSVTLTVDAATKVTSFTFATLSKVVLAGSIALNAAALAYTAALAIIASKKVAADQDSSAELREQLDKGEIVYLTATALNVVFMAASLILGVIQLIVKKTVDGANGMAPAQLPNLVMNSAGIKLQAGTNYIHIDPSGITVFGTQVFVAGPLTNVLPMHLTGNITPTGVATLVEFFGDIVTPP